MEPLFLKQRMREIWLALAHISHLCRAKTYSDRFFRRQAMTNLPILTDVGNASLFTKLLFIIFVPFNPPPPNQRDDGFPLEFLLKGPQTELRTLRQNCEQTLQNLRTNRIVKGVSGSLTLFEDF